jgi:hypothetical protein
MVVYGVTDRFSRWNALPTPRSVAILLAAAGAGIAPAMAAVDLSATATTSVEHNTNPIELSSREAFLFSPRGKKDLDDTSTSLTASVGAETGADGPLHINLQGLYSHTESERFNKLGHDDYNLAGNLDWKPSELYDVSLTGSHNREPIGLADVGGQRATLKTATSAQSTLRLRPVPKIQLGVTPAWSEIKMPLQGAERYRYSWTSGTVFLIFLGPGGLVPGLSANQTKGRYRGIGNATRYKQESIQGTLNYKASGFSTFSLAAGQTRRTTRLVEPSNDPEALAAEGTHSGFTGSLNYDRNLSVKTSITAGAFRYIQEYETGVGREIGTGVTGNITWKATSKLSVTLDSTFTLLNVQGIQFTGLAVDREDLVRSFTIGVGYIATRHLSLRTYLTRRIRNSNGTYADQFNASVGGLELTTTFD